MIRKVVCIGAGFVGGPLGSVIAYKCPDVQVTIVDKNKARVDAWNSDCLPMFEPGLEDLISSIRRRPQEPLGNDANACNLTFSTDVENAIEEADLIMLCIDTPTKRFGIGQGKALDLTNIQAAVRTIARVSKTDKIVVEKSTVPCGTADKIRDLLYSTSQNDCRFEVLSNPEFLSEGTTIKDLLHPSRVLIGHQQTPSATKAAEELASIYERWTPSNLIVTMDQWSSELSKLGANAMLAQRLSSINSLSAICEAVGADINSVSESCGLDPRIGNQMLRSTLGWGGGCFEKDVLCLVYLAESLGLTEVANYWAAVVEMNNYQKSRFFMRIVDCMHGCVGAKSIAILGFSFKKNTSDSKCSAAIPLAQNLITEGATVSVYDPMVQADRVVADVNPSNPSALRVCTTAYEACEGADAIVIATDWDEFQTPMSNGDIQMSDTKRNTEDFQSPPPTPDGEKHLDWSRIMSGMQEPKFIFDGRNMLDGHYLKRLGARYHRIGSRSTSS
ncbi:UDP-glucose 6-dehydrogenase 1 [Aspergillus wentii]|nr:UDP-glucose 6-dehydrogenase 1 [Aspergillus wentii]